MIYTCNVECVSNRLQFIDKLQSLHIFFNVLIQHMNIVCTQRTQPFIATQDDLKFVLAETKLRVLQE